MSSSLAPATTRLPRTRWPLGQVRWFRALPSLRTTSLTGLIQDICRLAEGYLLTMPPNGSLVELAR